MIRQRISNLFFLLIILLLACCKLNAQQDTLVIYETKVVYDTLYVYDTVRVGNTVSNPLLPSTNSPSNDSLFHFAKKDMAENALSFIRPLGPMLLINNCLKDGEANGLNLNGNNKYTRTATFSKNDIIEPKSKNTRWKMKDERNAHIISDVKRKNLNYGISTGLGMWWAKGTDNNLRSKYTASQNLGTFVEYPLINRFSLKAELNFTWLYKNNSLFDYHNILTDSAQITRESIYDSSSLGNIVHWDIDGVSDSAYDFYQFTLPVKLCYTFKNLQPYIGAEYVYRISGNGGKNVSLLNATAGLNVLISDRISVAINYSHGLLKEFSLNGTINGTTNGNTITLSNNTQITLPYAPESYIDKYSGPCRSQRLDISFYYNLSRKKNLRPKGFNP